MSTPNNHNADDLTHMDPRGADEARAADQALEAAIRRGLGGLGAVNEALETGKKGVWTLVVVLVALGAFIVKASFFFFEYSQNQAEAKTFRDATTAHLNSIDAAQQAKDASDRQIFLAQQVTNERLTTLVELLRRKVGE